MSSDCSERCSCSVRTGVTCQATGCPVGRVCEVEAGTRDCWVPAGLCSLSMGTNITTFDGAHTSISIPGIYGLSSTCPGLEKTIPWYRVLANVDSCHIDNKTVSQAHIFFQGGLVTVTTRKGVWVSVGTGACLPWAFVFLLQCPSIPGCPSLFLSVFFIQISAVWPLGLYWSQYFELSPSVLAEFWRSKNTLM